ncbi:replication endonuclease [Vibrio splendidus]|uniref:replication endonuclease n=1 Tax=Vibrio splendidus TaxID=29497 RepID=UPI000C82E112|nr:replication endonuclease [Vibrio splendidus]PMK36875.1 replication protein [Vibrio splendidus]
MTYYQPVKPLNRFWLCPLPAIDEGLICVPAGYEPANIEPQNLSVVERKLYEVNPADREWLSEHFADLPHYLTKYFANRYISIFEKQGRPAANTFIREKMVPAHRRVLLVLKQYKKLPTTSKVALLSEANDDTKQSNYKNQTQQQQYFDFERIEQNRKPVRNRTLAELEIEEITDMAFKVAMIVDGFIRIESDKYHAETALGTEMAVVFSYEQAAVFVCNTFGIKPPRKYKEQSELSALQDISRMISEKWWYNRLIRCRKIMREHLAIAMGQVSKHASPYASWDCIREYKEQRQKNWEFIENSSLFDEETGEEASLKDMVLKSVSNPAIRRHELMVRCRGCEDIGNELGLQGLFLTLTTPAKYHNSYKKGGFIGHWNGASPRDAQAYLNNVWAKIRAKLGRKEIRWFGVRVAEPHHDGTPHWHLLIWAKPEQIDAIEEIFTDYAIQEDKHELINKEGLLDPSARCDIQAIDPELGTATGYIAKYISKNIDGYAMDDDLADETVSINPKTGKEEGKSAKDMAINVSAWKSRWNIRQFQFFGGAPVTTYRELRRFASQNKKAFMEYLFMQERADLLTIYSMLQRELVGPIKPSKLITNEELLKVIGDSYQARIKSDDSSIVDTLIAADNGNWQGYIMGQGGPFVKRDDLLIRNTYQELPFASPHGEIVSKIEGFDAAGMLVKTRTKNWQIMPTSTLDAQRESGALALSGASGSSRSSVNNCTLPQKVQVSDQLKRLLEPYSVGGGLPPNIDGSALIALQKGSSIRIDDETSIRVRPAEHLPCGTVRPAQLVEEYQPKPDLSWLDELEVKPPGPLTGEDDDYEYEQPNLSFFPETDEWPLI